MARIITIILIAGLVFTSCETTGTYVKEGDSSYTGTGTSGDSLTERDLFTDEEREERSKKLAELAKQGRGEEKKDSKETVMETTEAPVRLDDDTLAVIGKWVLTKEKYRIITSYMKEKFDYKLTPDQEKEFIQYIINKKLMALEARAEGYAEKKDVQVKYEWDFDDIISHKFYSDRVENKSKVISSQAKKYYDRHRADFTEIKAQHILVKNRKLAKSLHKRLLGGESFDDLAKKYSEDETTKGSGGNLGFFAKGIMVKEFEEAAFSLAKGSISDPVKTIYGYHIIKVLEKRSISFGESKDRIVKMIADKKKKVVFEGLMDALKKKYNVVINEDVIE